MSDHVYRVVEVVGSSSDSTDAAIENAIAHYQVTVKVGFRVEPGDAV